MLDSGCTTCIIPISRLPEDARRHMSKTKHPSQRNRREHLYSGQAHLRHYLGVTILLTAFCNVNTLITTSDIPILIGQNILGHHTLLSYTIDNQKATVELARTLPSGKLKTYCPALYNRPSKDKTDPQPFTRRPNRFQRGTTSHSQIIA